MSGCPPSFRRGQQQRVAVARALAQRPQVLLMDEPFGALDAKIREELRRTVRQIQRELGIATILVTHDQEEAIRAGGPHRRDAPGPLARVRATGRALQPPGHALRATFLRRGQPAARLQDARGRELHDGAARGRTPARGRRCTAPEEVELASTWSPCSPTSSATAQWMKCCSAARSSGCGSACPWTVR